MDAPNEDGPLEPVIDGQGDDVESSEGRRATEPQFQESARLAIAPMPEPEAKPPSPAKGASVSSSSAPQAATLEEMREACRILVKSRNAINVDVISDDECKSLLALSREVQHLKATIIAKDEALKEKDAALKAKDVGIESLKKEVYAADERAAKTVSPFKQSYAEREGISQDDSDSDPVSPSHYWILDNPWI